MPNTMSENIELSMSTLKNSITMNPLKYWDDMEFSENIWKSGVAEGEGIELSLKRRVNTGVRLRQGRLSPHCHHVRPMQNSSGTTGDARRSAGIAFCSSRTVEDRRAVLFVSCRREGSRRFSRGHAYWASANSPAVIKASFTATPPATSF